MEIKVFKNEKFGQLRTATNESNELLFCLSDVCKVLELTNPSSVVSRLEQNDVYKVDLGRDNQVVGNSIANYITESALYDVILFSTSKSVRPFQRWVTHEVLPSIRKTGGYIPVDVEDTDEAILSKALLIAQKTLEKKDEIIANKQKLINSQQMVIEGQQPKVLFADAVSTSNTSILIGELAKLICQNGVSIGQNRLFEWLRENKYLTKTNEPTQKSMDLKLFEVLERTINNPDGSVRITRTTKTTGKGQVYFINKFLN